MNNSLRERATRIATTLIHAGFVPVNVDVETWDEQMEAICTIACVIHIILHELKEQEEELLQEFADYVVRKKNDEQ